MGKTEGNGSVVRQRLLARHLRLLREEAGLTLAVAAPKLDWSVSTLSRIELAQQTVDVHGVRSMLDLYDASDRWAELTELAREARQRGWWTNYHLVRHRIYVAFESEACQKFEFAMSYPPGLLQTADYARALVSAAWVHRTPAELENSITVRMLRQRRLTCTDNPLSLEAIIDESVLLRPVGGPEVLRQQLLHLVDAAELATVSLRVIPMAAGAHAALESGFSVLSFGELGVPDVAYVEHALDSLIMDKESQLANASQVCERLRATALDTADSLDLIRRLASIT